ncbi:unnamed protein product [Caenorhabditis auriculariae]|uniref:Hook C-terminal domain-containing protein n=1 Tax=Caenorhabditis auriculariae TaxID=2777116 RepID=A0A8S1HGM4_9PELO|nr:unnamed protein product [Caenorhabditis auriculariae]
MALESDTDSVVRDSSSDIENRVNAGPSKPPPSPEELAEMKNELQKLASWFHGFPGFHRARQLDLEDPIAMCNCHVFAEFLHLIKERTFDDAWLNTIVKGNSVTNNHVKRSAIRKLMRQLTNYITIELGCRVETERWNHQDAFINGTVETDLPVVLNLATLIVGVAHFGPTAKKIVPYSSELTSTAPDCMRIVANMVKEVLTEIPALGTLKGGDDDDNDAVAASEAAVSDRLNESSFRISSGSEVVESYQLQKLTTQLSETARERDKLALELETMQVALRESEMAAKASTSDPAITFLEDQNKNLKERLRESEDKHSEQEGLLDSLRTSVKELTENNTRLMTENRDVSQLKSEIQSLRDELEISRDQLGKSRVDSERRKQIEKELKERDAQIKLQQSRLDHYITKSTAESADRDQIKTLRQQIGNLNGTIESLEGKLVHSEKQISELENELVKMKERNNALESRKEELTIERNELQNKLLDVQASDSNTERSLHDSLGADNELLNNNSFERQKLEVENKRLHERVQELEGLEQLQGEVSILKNRNATLEGDAQLAEKRRDDLMVQIADLQQKLDSSQLTVQGGVADLTIQLEKALIEGQKSKDVAERTERRLNDLEDELEKKVKENEKLHRGLEGAKMVIDDLESHVKVVDEDGGKTSVQQFRQLQMDNEQKEKRIRQLEEELENGKRKYEEETRLVATGFHAAVLDRNRDAMTSTTTTPQRRTVGGGTVGSPDVDGANGQPAAFLTRQKMHQALPWSGRLLRGVLIFLMSFLIMATMLFSVHQYHESGPPMS